MVNLKEEIKENTKIPVILEFEIKKDAGMQLEMSNIEKSQFGSQINEEKLRPIDITSFS